MTSNFSRRTTVAMGTTLIALIALIGAGSTLHAADKEQRQMMADIRMLQEQTQQLQNLIASLSTSIEAAVKAVNARVDSRLEEQTSATRKAFADQALTINNLGQDVRTVKEQLADTSVRVGTLTEEIKALRQIVTLLNVPAPPSADIALDASGAVPAAPSPTAPAAPTAATLGASPTEFWRIAENDYFNGKYDLSISEFRNYISAFGGDRADDAQAYVCRAYTQMGKYQDAVRECDLVIRNYPSSDRLAEAYYRKGMALKSLKQTADARLAFNAAITQAPDGDAAQLSRQQIEGLDETKKP